MDVNKNETGKQLENNINSEEPIVDANIVEETQVQNEYNEEEITKDIKEDIKVNVVKPKKKKKRNLKAVIALGLLFAMVGGLFIGVGYNVSEYYLLNKIDGTYEVGKRLDEKGSSAKTTIINTSSVSESTSQIAEHVGPSVVAITSKVKVLDWFQQLRIQEGAGSGIIFDINSKGIYIVTNNHVIDNAQEVTVLLSDKVKAPAEVIGSDEDTDLAVLKIDKKDVPIDVIDKLAIANFGDSDKLKPGEIAIAIGNPLGYNNTVTQGVISALNRDLGMSDSELRLIQTDAAINPGNSGGALVNSKGEVIGINTIKIADTKVEGIGFAIPINYAKPVIKDLVEIGVVPRPFLGIAGRDIDENLAQMYELPIGVFVQEVYKGSPADKAGLKVNDIIISIDDNKVFSMEQLIELIKKHDIGDTVKLKIIRDAKEKIEITAKLEDKNKVISN